MKSSEPFDYTNPHSRAAFEGIRARLSHLTDEEKDEAIMNLCKLGNVLRDINSRLQSEEDELRRQNRERLIENGDL